MDSRTLRLSMLVLLLSACDSEDGWESWKVGLAAEVGRLAGCGGAFHAAPALAMLAALWLALPSVSKR